MARGSTRLILVLIAVLGAVPMRAAETGATDPVQPLEWLKAGHYAALDEYYSHQQRDFEEGRIPDDKLYASFRRLYQDSLDNAGLYDHWVEAYPRSYAAVLARGVYAYRMAWAVRGEMYIRDTPSGQIESMKNWLSRARPDLLASLKLTDKPYLSTLYLLNVAMLQGSAEERRQWYERGMAIDPGNSLIRYRYMFSLRPRWGGSYKEMEDYLAQVQAQQAAPALLARLGMLIHADKAEDAMRAGDNQKILDEWQEVLNLAPVAGEEPSNEALIGYTRAAQDLHRGAEAQRGLELLEDRHPQDAWSQGRLGWIYVQAHQDEKAWTLLAQAAEKNDSWAQWVIGHSTYDGVPALHKAPDHQAGLVWIRRSAGQCYPDAVQFLAAHGEKQSADCRRRTNADRGWASVLLAAAPALFTTLITGLIAVSRKRKPIATSSPGAIPGRMQQPPATLAVGIAVLVACLGLAAIALVARNGTDDEPLLPAVCAALGALGLLLILQYARVWHQLTADGLEFGRLLGPRGSLRWRDVTRLTYSRGARSFRIETASGEVARISANLTGTLEFARAVLGQVPSYALDDSTRAMLQALVQGEQPRLPA